ncbi:hypothetical protein Landi51_07777 [Colletotrichum acutatum]
MSEKGKKHMGIGKVDWEGVGKSASTVQLAAANTMDSRSTIDAAEVISSWEVGPRTWVPTGMHQCCGQLYSILLLPRESAGQPQLIASRKKQEAGSRKQEATSSSFNRKEAAVSVPRYFSTFAIWAGEVGTFDTPAEQPQALWHFRIRDACCIGLRGKLAAM